MRKNRIYVASSWRNIYQNTVVDTLRVAGNEVYDFKNPFGGSGFAWRQIDENWEHWTTNQYREALDHPTSQKGFRSDFEGMDWADEFCLVLPCGRSAHLEAGWAMGCGKRTSIYIPQPERIEPELMYLLARGGTKAICSTMEEVVQFHKLRSL